jgi:ribonuclease HI/exonuclease III
MSRPGAGPVAGRPLPDEEVIQSKVSRLESRKARLRQRTLFEYGVPTEGPQHERGLPKVRAEFDHPAHSSMPWGDPIASGQQVKDSGIFRLVSHNVNGLSPANDHIDVVDMAKAMEEREVAIFGLQETNRNFERAPMVDSFHRVIRGTSTHHKGGVSSAKLQWPQDYQPGGTATSVRNQWATRFLAKGSDVYGRWSWLTLAGRGTKKITFISAYRVCDGAPEAPITSKTVRAQQEWMYADRGFSSVNLRAQFVTDIIILMNELQQHGHEVVLMSDLNEASGLGSAADKLCFECNLADAHSLGGWLHPPPTYHRGSEKIDFVLISASLAPAVRASAILALHDGYLSDHRALLVDFDARTMFMSDTSPITPAIDRRLTSTSPREVHTYMESMRLHVSKHDLINKIKSLQGLSDADQWSDDCEREWEILDKLLADARLSSEGKCTVKLAGQVPWSPALQLAGRRFRYWRLRLSEYSMQPINQDELKKLATQVKISITDRGTQSNTYIRQQIRRAKRALSATKSKAQDLRTEHLQERATFLEATHGLSAKAACNAIAARERSSRQFRQLRAVLNPGVMQGLDRIDVPNKDAVLRRGEDIPRIPLVVREEIEEALVPHTEQRFRQHQETPFGGGVRQQELGIDCSSRDARALMNGTYDRELETLSEEARVWLRELRTKTFVTHGATINTTISTEDWIRGWKKMRESTSSAPGGHYGHYKTAAVAATLPEDHADYWPVLAELYATMASMPLRHGFAPKRWQTCIDAILEKIPGQPRIEKLRIIMLYEADFNFVLKLIWGRRLVRHAELHNCLGEENQGSRSGRQAPDSLLQKLFVYEYARLTRTSVITVDNDAKSCYDRIIKSLAMIACIGVGLPLLAAAMHNNTHHGMKHSIKTRHGTLRPYQGTDDDALEGTGQGSGASPAIWLIYSVSLLRAFQQFTPGMTVSSPFESLLVTILAIFYVDDGMPGVNDSQERDALPLELLLQQAEDATQSWERLLFASGGALEMSKCFAYVLYWDLADGKHRLILPDEIPGGLTESERTEGPISLTYGDQSSALHKLETVSPWVGRRTLGVRIAPAGTWCDEFQYRRTQSRDLALKIAGSALSRETARTGYYMMVRPKLEYPLTVTQFTQLQCDRITSPVIRACLSKMGYNCNSPKEVVYGPQELFGFGIHDYYIEQGIKQLIALVGHIRQDSETGRLMRIELQWCQVQAGTEKHLLGEPQDPIDYIETCWIMCIRDFIRTYGLRIAFSKTPIPETQCVNDEFIMDALRERGDCSATELQRINACRMFLQVARVSDITSADGKFLRTESLVGRKTTTYRSSSHWPRQGRPPKLWWSLWKKKLQLILSCNGASSKLRLPLGQWSTAMLQHEWETVHSAMSGQSEIFIRQQNGEYAVFGAEGSTTGKHLRVSHTKIGTTDRCPTDAVPVSMGPKRRDGSQRVTLRTRLARTQIHDDDQVTSFAEFVGRQATHIQDVLQYADLSNSTASAVAHQIDDNSPLYGGTDGGLLNGAGTFGFVWADHTEWSTLATGKGQVPGHSHGMSSTRAELCGIFAALAYLNLVSKYHHLVPNQARKQCTIYCDSKAALQRISDLSYAGFGTTWRCRANYDLEAAIKGCLQDSAMLFSWTWVKGHARRRKPVSEFTWAETLNDYADVLATSAREIRSVPTATHWPEQIISIEGPRGRITGRLDREIRYCCTATDLLSYWQQRYHWSAKQVTSIDILGTRSASKKLRPDSARRIQKLRCGWLPVNTRESRSDPDRTSGCSACSTSNLVPETVDHVFQCPSPSRRSALHERSSTLVTHFRSIKTSRSLISALHTGAMAWAEQREPPSVESLTLPDNRLGELIRQAYDEQTSLGWNVLFRGFWSISWRLAQEEQFRMYRSREVQDTGEIWASNAQMWFYETFELLWAQRNEAEHGIDHETERLIRLTKCDRAVRRLYDKGEDLPYAERHPFRDSMDDLLQQPLQMQELWIDKTTAFLRKAFQRQRARPRGQPAITNFFARLHE